MAAGALIPSPYLDGDALRDWRACARRFWLRRHAAAAADTPAAPPPAPHNTDTADPPGDGPPTSPRPAQAGRSDSPPATGALADEALRAHYPGATVLPPPHSTADWARNVQQTLALLRRGGPAGAGEGWALIGACLASADGVRLRVDVVQRAAHGWRLLRLRWATAGDDADIDQVALAAHVAAHAGLRVAWAGLLLVDSDFLYPGHGLYAGLLREVDLGPVLGTRAVGSWLTAMHALQRAAAPRPPVPLAAPCSRDGGCPQLAACELPQAPQRHSADPRAALEILGRELADELRGEGHRSVHDVPLARLHNPRLRRAAQAVQQGRPVVEPAAGAWLRALPWPRHGLRVETIGFAVPPWPGTRPYQVLPFQASISTQRANDASSVSKSALADPHGPDPRPALAQALLDALGHDDGPILAYNAGFERNRITDLARHLPAQAVALQALLPRIVDVFALLRANAYHPDMAGAWSARAVYQAWVPAVGAHRTQLPGGRSVLQAYGALVQRAVPEEAAPALLAALQAHGERQLAALWALVGCLHGAG